MEKIVKRFGIIISLFLCTILLSFAAEAQELIEITSDDIILNEPDFSDYIKSKMPHLNKALLNLNKEMPVNHLKVDVKDFDQFWTSIDEYYLRKEIAENKIRDLNKEASVIREKIFQQPNLTSPRTMRLVLEYKFQKKNIEHCLLSIDTLDQDLNILLQVLKDSNITSPFEKATDLKSYAGILVNEIQKLKSSGENYFGKYEEHIDQVNEDQIKNAKHLKKQFLNLGIEISGAFHMATELGNALKSLENGVSKVYNYELYIMENKKITPATLIGTFISILVLILVYFVIKKLLNVFLGSKGFTYALNTLSKYCFILVSFVVLLQGIGLDLAKITILVSALSVGIGFGLTTLVSNFIAGIIILIEGSISKGDKLRVGELGVVDVMTIGIRKSILRTLDGEDVVLPNTELVTKEIVNLTHKDNTITRHCMPFSINPHVDFKKMQEVAIESCVKTLGGKENIVGKDPVILVNDLAHANLVCELVYFLDYENNFIPDKVFKTNLLNAFYENGLNIFTAPITPVELVNDEEAKNPNVKQPTEDLHSIPDNQEG